jgi:hypothetical protein
MDGAENIRRLETRQASGYQKRNVSPRKPVRKATVTKVGLAIRLELSSFLYFTAIVGFAIR